MKRQTLVNILIVLVALLVAEVLFVVLVPAPQAPETHPTEEATLPTEPSTGETVPETSQETQEVTEEETEAVTEEVTEEVTEAPTETEPEVNSYILTFVGDCTMGSEPATFQNPSSFVYTIGENYAWPFANVQDYFANDDFTIINFEGVLADTGNASDKLFTFRAPTAFAQILSTGSVEAVTLANNHTMDFGAAGYKSTKDAIAAQGVTYVEDDGSAIYTTENGLTIGIYAVAFDRYDAGMRNEIAKLRNQGAEIIVAAVHWGDEGTYRATKAQKDWAHVLIDAGVDIVYGHHPHVLQPVEEYKDGLIFYSLGNFSFGGNTWPRDPDSAIMQVEVVRNDDGSASLGELTIVPVRITSLATGENNFQPTPYDPDSKEYDRVLSKLDGTFTGPDLTVDYSFLNPTEPEATEPEATEPETPPETQPETPPDTGSGDTGSEDTGADAGTGDAGSGDTGGGDTGAGDAGSGDTGGGDAGAGDAGSGDTGGGDAGGSADTGGGSDAGSGDAGVSE